MARKRAGEHQEENVERWLLTYADMITLMMAFFIMMFAMSQVDRAKFAAVVQSVQRQLGASTAPEGKVDLMPLAGGTGIADGFAAATCEMLQREIEGSPAAKYVSFDDTPTGLVVRIQMNGLLFEAGRADVTEAMGALLDRIAKALARVPNPIQIEGHTCDLPLRSSRYRDNWELSSARAVNVVLHFIRSNHLPPGRFTASGLADTNPLLPNTCEENRRCNRRIDIILVKGRPVQTRADDGIDGIQPNLQAGVKEQNLMLETGMVGPTP